MNNSFKKKIWLGVVVFLVSFLLTHQTVLAATHTTSNRVYLKGPTTNIAMQSEFLVSVLMDTSEPINAFDIEISYPKNKLKFLKFDNTQSIVDIWQPEPEVLDNGNIKLSGGMFKAWNKKGGLLIKLGFKTIGEEEAKLSFQKNNLYIADGKATEVIASTGDLSFSIAQPEDKTAVVLSIPPPEVDDTPPEMFLKIIEDPAEFSSLVIFKATDKESGIKQTDMRVKKWWSFSDWQPVKNPALYPRTAWAIEIRAINNAGLESIEVYTNKNYLYIKLGLIFFGFILLFVCVVAVYNVMKRKP